MTLDLPLARSDVQVGEGPKGGARVPKRKDKWLNSTHIPFVDDKRTRYGRAEVERLDREVAEHGVGRDEVPTGRDTVSENVPPMAADVSQAHRAGSNGDPDDGIEQHFQISKGNGTDVSKNSVPMSQEGEKATYEKGTPRNSASPDAAVKGIPHDIQIMELHSKNPIVLYQKQQFECSWSENIGTELLFIKHSDTSNESGELPVVRGLPGEVDLLAVSGVRVVGRPINLRPKEKSSENGPNEKIQAEAQIPATKPRKNTEHTLPECVHRIPVGMGAKEDRKAQARFLERLSAIKLKRGEHDEVTVNAIPRKEGRARKEKVHGRNRERNVLHDKRRSEARKNLARTRLAEWDTLDAIETGGGENGGKSSNSVSFGTTNGKSLGAHGISRQVHAQDESMDEDTDPDGDDYDEEGGDEGEESPGGYDAHTDIEDDENSELDIQ